jgi:hypothetical protein
MLLYLTVNLKARKEEITFARRQKNIRPISVASH